MKACEIGIPQQTYNRMRAQIHLRFSYAKKAWGLRVPNLLEGLIYHDAATHFGVWVDSLGQHNTATDTLASVHRDIHSPSSSIYYHHSLPCAFR